MSTVWLEAAPEEVADNILAAPEAAMLEALPLAVLLIGPEGEICHANPAAEELFGTSRAVLAKRGLAGIVAPFSSLLALVEQVRFHGQTMFEHEVELDLPRNGGTRLVDLRAAPLAGEPQCVVLSLTPRSLAERLGRHLQQRDSGRSNAAMAATLAHEVRNPLSGIRGAAQLLEAGADEDDRALARMIRDEADRIAALIDRMEIFGDESLPRRAGALNVHEVLDHVRLIAASGFASHASIATDYDPSLPPVLGSRDELVQAFLNLFKNAAEALPARGGRITVKTSYEHGLRVNDAGRARVHLPIAIRIEDNGSGIPEELRDCLFEPFVTAKPGGTGLGLAFVAKAVADHSGVVEVDSTPGGTVFRVLLPAALEEGRVP
jgi:two-component system nitrogen regulation sensor histidine kinase GlnL